MLEEHSFSIKVVIQSIVKGKEQKQLIDNFYLRK